jgi:hypothetical protein
MNDMKNDNTKIVPMEWFEQKHALYLTSNGIIPKLKCTETAMRTKTMYSKEL